MRNCKKTARKFEREVVVNFPPLTKVLGNVHKVPAKVWRTWRLGAKWMFNNMMRQMSDSRKLTHPGYERCSDEYWKTIRWNSAWIAAELENEQLKMKRAQW